MNTLLAPGPWHVTTDDHIVRDINGSPIAVVLARHPRAHAELIAELPNIQRKQAVARDLVIADLRERLAMYEGIERELDELREELSQTQYLLDAALKSVGIIDENRDAQKSLTNA